MTPKINVTPLIDVLLVLLIIFMVVAPLRPNSFRVKLPAEPIETFAGPDPLTIVVSLGRDRSLSLNDLKELGTADDPGPLVERLRTIFEQRSANGALDDEGRVVKAVFVKAPRKMDYGSVVRVIDALKLAGADPMALQIDYLD